MIVIGILILIGVAAVAVAAIARGGMDVSVDVGSFTVKTDAAGMFLAGAATMLCALIALWLLRKGLGRARERRHEVRELRDRLWRNEVSPQRDQPTSPDRTDLGDDTMRAEDYGQHVADDRFDSAPRDR
jgi:hypothetical protein